MQYETVEENGEEVDDDADGGSLDESVVLGIMFSGCVGIVVSFASLLASMEKSYRHTFISTQTGNQQIQSIFTDNDDDEQKFMIFYFNRNKWEEPIGATVKHWLLYRIQFWIAEEQEWLTEEKMERIPEDILSKQLLHAMVQQNRKNRKKSGDEMIVV